MPEYIEREAAVEAVRCSPDMAINEELEGLVRDVPAADVEPVRHGRWNSPLDKRRKASLRCSQCFGLSHAAYAYCPNCGAKMDEEVEE